MARYVKQVVGIDVSQDELVVCLARMDENWEPELYARVVFPNTLASFKKLQSWVQQHIDASVPLRFVMEATGVYHEALAYYLDEHGMEVSIILPNKVSNYVRTLAIKTITDKTASEAIARFGVERKLECWHRPKEIYRTMRQLCREADQLKAERSMAKNQRHAEKAEALPNKRSLERVDKRIAFLDKQIKEIESDLQKLIQSDPEVAAIMRRLCTIPGVGVLTAETVIAETNCFELIANKRQLTSYAGLDVKEKQSGTSVKGKPRISKKGNRHLRKALHMPALAAIRHDNRYKALFLKLVEKHGIKMKAVVAVQRRVLELMYTLYKTGSNYNPNHCKSTVTCVAADTTTQKKLGDNHKCDCPTKQAGIKPPLATAKM